MTPGEPSRQGASRQNRARQVLTQLLAERLSQNGLQFS